MNLTKKEQLLDWMRRMKTFASHQVMRWGLDYFYLRADRTKRDFIKQGLIRKLTKEEKRIKGIKSKEAYYEYVQVEKQLAMF